MTSSAVQRIRPQREGLEHTHKEEQWIVSTSRVCVCVCVRLHDSQRCNTQSEHTHTRARSMDREIIMMETLCGHLMVSSEASRIGEGSDWRAGGRLTRRDATHCSFRTGESVTDLSLSLSLSSLSTLSGVESGIGGGIVGIGHFLIPLDFYF